MQEQRGTATDETPERGRSRWLVTRRSFLMKGAVAGAAATALYVAPQFTSTYARRAYAQVTGPCIWAGIQKIDFEKYPLPLPGGGEAATYSGQVIDNAYDEWGVKIWTSNGLTHPAMIFDSEAAAPPGGDHVTGGDHDLRTPSLYPGFHGEWHSTNKTHLHKILIISEDNAPDDPDDEAGGGEIFFEFKYPPAVTYVDILDMDDGNTTNGSGRAKLWADVGRTTLINSGGDPDNRYKFLELGNNSWQRINIAASDQVAVKVLEIEFNSSGAVAEIGFKCP